MPPKKTELQSKNKKESTNITKEPNYSNDSSIIETTYEKVLSIINKVKDFIKKNSKNSQKLIDDLEWVIKVIANKSLYSYELKKPNLIRQNSEFNKFVYFVTKYNEEIIEINKRHILVSGLLNLVKKGEILNKPSLCLKKISPEELKNMDYQKEKEKKNRKKNLINLIGNAILNLYYKTIEKQKKEKEEKHKINFNIEDSKIKLNDMKNVEKINENKNKKEVNKIDKIVEHQNKQSKKKSTEGKKDYLDSTYRPKKYLVNYITSHSCGKRKNISNQSIKASKNEKPSYLNTLKKSIDNYYNKRNDNNPNIKQYKTKGSLVKNKNKTIYNNNSQNNRITNLEKNAFFSYKYNKIKKYRFDKFDEYDKNKSYEIKNNESSIIKYKNKTNNNLDIIEKSDFNNKSYMGRHSNKLFYKKIHNENKINKHHFNKVINEKKLENELNKDIVNTKQEINNNIIFNDNNINSGGGFNYNIIINNNNNQPITSKKQTLKTLIDEYFNDMKKIVDKDFDIFEFKSKVGYRNVLPLMCHCILKALGLVDNRIINLSKLEAFLFSINDNYKETTLYHNSLHGADVTQTLCVFFLNTNAEQILEASVLDLLGMIISSMGHDLGHPGLTNNFHINACTELALTYNDSSCLENYHCSYLFNILKKDETNILDKLNVENYKNIRKRMISQILATDMANHGEVMSLIRTKIKLYKQQQENISDEQFILLSGNEKTKFDEQQVLFNYMIHMADLGHNCKKYEISKQWVKILCEEFWIQGDKEKSLGIPVSFLCDRDKIDVPASQVNFLKGFIISSFDSLAEMFPILQYTLNNAKNNIKEWQKLLEQKRMTGWTPKKEKKEKENE